MKSQRNVSLVSGSESKVETDTTTNNKSHEFGERENSQEFETQLKNLKFFSEDRENIILMKSSNDYVLSTSRNVGQNEFTTSDLIAAKILNEEFPEPEPPQKFEWTTHIAPIGTILLSLGASIFGNDGLKGWAVAVFTYNIISFCLTVMDKWKSYKKSKEKVPRSRALSVEISIARMRGLIK